MTFPSRFSRFLIFTGSLLVGSVHAQQTGDSLPVDATQILKVLKQLRDEQDLGTKQRRTTVQQQVLGAASSGERAAAFWKEAAKTVMFEGSDKEASQTRDWKDGDGEAFNSKECQNAARLHLQWLALSLQHAGGVETKKLLPSVIDFTKQVNAAAEAMEHFSQQIEKEKDRPNPAAKKNAVEDQVIKKVYEQILRTGVNGTVISRWLQLGELLNDAEAKKLQPTLGGWEMVPGNVEGIYGAIILPEFRTAKDPRLLEYWDMVIKRETEHAAGKKLDVDQRDWANIKRPSLLWSRSQDVLLLGFRNRAISEMFNLVKSYPTHPNAKDWIAQLEKALTAKAPAVGLTGTGGAGGTTPTTGAAGTTGNPGITPTNVAPTVGPARPVAAPVVSNPPVAVAVEVDDVPEGTIPVSELSGAGAVKPMAPKTPPN